MSSTERIFQAILFELLALILLTIIGMLLIDEDPVLLGGTAFTLSIIAMVWNYIFNIGFDRIFGEDRINRTMSIRVVHTLSFEVGVLVFTVPVIMWFLSYSFWQALLLDLVTLIFFLIYTLAFHYGYDHLSAYFKKGLKEELTP